ncbi:MAG: hypothetical protein ACK4NC_05895 [Candidatus Gracilibacteria bacterium]
MKNTSYFEVLILFLGVLTPDIICLYEGMNAQHFTYSALKNIVPMGALYTLVATLHWKRGPVTMLIRLDTDGVSSREYMVGIFSDIIVIGGFGGVSAFLSFIGMLLYRTEGNIFLLCIAMALLVKGAVAYFTLRCVDEVYEDVYKLINTQKSIQK